MSKPIQELSSSRDRLWDEEHAAHFLGESVEFLRADRAGANLIPHRKLDGRVAYAIADVVAYKNRVDAG